MGEPEVEPGAQPGTLASEHSETAEEINRDTDAPLSPNPTKEAALSEVELEDKGTVSLAGEVSAIAEEVALGDEKGEAVAMAGDGNASVKEEEAEAQEVSTIEYSIQPAAQPASLHEAVVAGTEEEVAMAGDGNASVKEEEAVAQEVPTVECSVQPADLQEAVIASTEEAVTEEGPQMDHVVKREEVDDQVEASIKEEVGPAVETGSFSEVGAVAEVVIPGDDDMMAKREEEIEQEVGLVGEAERKEENFTETDEKVPHTDQEMVHSGTNNEGADGLQSEDKNLTRDEETKINEAMNDGPTDEEALHTDQETVQSETNNERADGLQSEDNNLTQDEDTKMDESMHEHQTDEEAPHTDQEMACSKTNNEGVDDLQSGDNNITQDEETTMDESMHDDHGGGKAMDEDLTPDGDDDKRMEASMGVDGDNLDDTAADDQAPEHGDEGVGTNEGEDDEDDDPPPLPAKRSSSGKKKRARPTRIKKGEEELCFICFDGGELVVCDRRSDY